MDEQVRQVEITFGELGRSCNTRVLERKIEHLRAMDESIRARGMDRALSMEPNHGVRISNEGFCQTVTATS